MALERADAVVASLRSGLFSCHVEVRCVTDQLWSLSRIEVQIWTHRPLARRIQAAATQIKFGLSDFGCTGVPRA